MNDLHLITFKCNNTEFGINITDIDCIIKVIEITKLNNKNKCIKGIINLRNEIVPIIDLREYMQNEALDFHDACRIIIFNYKNDDKINKIGFIIDEIKNIVEEDSSKMQKPEIMSSHQYIDGIIDVDNRLITIINLSFIINEILEKNWVENI